MNRDRFRFFQSVHHESDLLIGVRHRDFSRTMVKTALVEQTRLRKLLMDHIKSSPSFGTSLEPLPYPSSRENTLDAPHLPDEILTMLRSAQQTATGPMSSVAGLFAEKVGRRLIGAYGLDEIVVENGGDLFVKNSSDLVSVIHAGTSNLSDKMAFVITPGKWGICTSSGTIGHSFSRGKAEAVTVIAERTPLADAWATSLANRVTAPDDVELVLDMVSEIEEILGCAVILGDKVGIRGQFEVKLLS